MCVHPRYSHKCDCNEDVCTLQRTHPTEFVSVVRRTHWLAVQSTACTLNWIFVTGWLT